MTDAPGPRCAHCGAPCRKPFRAPAAELAPDLDGRPGEPARSSLKRWVMRCPACGAVAPDLAALPAAAAETIRSEAYAAEPDPFLRWALIAQGAGLGQDAAEATLQAAWAMEDAGGDAAPLRRRAAGLWQGDPLRKLDVLRRAGALDEASALAAGMSGLDEVGGRILAFQQGLIAAGDRSRHAISSALRPPARTPHVTHGQKKPARGLFARLFGQ